MIPADREEMEGRSYVYVGSARLPKTLAGERGDVLMIELVSAAPYGAIEEIATTIDLPGYNSVLRSILVGRRLDDLGDVHEELRGHVLGPLQRPTVAALTNAVSARSVAQDEIGQREEALDLKAS